MQGGQVRAGCNTHTIESETGVQDRLVWTGLLIEAYVQQEPTVISPRQGSVASF